MIITTLQFGELNIEEWEVFFFHQALPGLEDYQRYIFIQPDPESPFVFLQSIENGDIALVLTNPFLFFSEYDFELSEGVIKELEIESAEDVVVWSVVSVKDRVEEATLNLLAPIVVNVNTRVGKQVILHESPYSTKHKLALSETSEAE